MSVEEILNNSGASSTRIWRALEEQTPSPHTCASTLGVALVCWALDPGVALTSVQRQWVHKRVHLLAAKAHEAWMTPADTAVRNELLAAGRTLTEKEAAKIVPLLLTWSAGKTFDAALREGIRDNV